MAPESKQPWWKTSGLAFAGGWHPLAGRVRAGNQADNLEEEYEWEYSEEHIRRLKDLGITVLMSQFDRGLGDADQAEAQEKARVQAELCHQHGLHHGSYMANTIYFESMLKDYPDCETWAVKTHDGRLVHYGGEQSWRWVACFNSPGWRARMKRQIEKAIDVVKTDWLHFDNLAVWPEPDSCHCAHCQAAFRQFLESRYPTPEEQKKRFGYAGFATFRAPNFYLRFSKPWDIDRIQNPLMQEWILFRCWTVTDYIRDMAEYGRSLKPDICVDSNAQSIWGVNQAFLHGVDQEAQSAQVDVICEENPDYHADDHPQAIYPVTRKMRGMNFYRRLGKPILTAYDDEESLAFNLAFCGIPGINTNWGYAEPGRKPLNPHQPGVKALLDHYRRHLQLYTRVASAARVGVWRGKQALAYVCTDTHLAVCVMEQLLFNGRIPFSIVPDGFICPERLAGFDLLILANVEFISDEQAATLTGFVKQGGNLLITEFSGMYAGNGRRRTTPAFNRLFETSLRASSLALGETADFNPHAQFALRGQAGFPAFAQYGQGRAAYLPRIDYVHRPRAFKSNYNVHYDGIDSRYWKEPYNHREISDAIRWLDPGCEPVKVYGLPELRLDYVRWEDGATGVMLLRCGELHGGRDVPLAVRSAAEPRGSRLFRPEQAEPINLAWSERGGYYETLLPGINRHAVLKLTGDK